MPVVGDGAADHIGSCGFDERTASLMVGTSAAMRVAFRGDPPAEIPGGLWAYRIDRDRVIAGGALSDGGNLYQKIKRQFKITGRVRNEGPVAGLLVLPFFFGERSTGYNENARGQILGGPPLRQADILQASMEGVAYRLADVYGRLKKVTRIERIVASGGALRDSEVWTQIIADVIGRDIIATERQESASKGAVLLALERLGKIESVNGIQMADERLLRFHPERHGAYKKARKQHQKAYEETQKIS
jgi:gluconokinase